MARSDAGRLGVDVVDFGVWRNVHGGSVGRGRVLESGEGEWDGAWSRKQTTAAGAGTTSGGQTGSTTIVYAAAAAAARRRQQGPLGERALSGLTVPASDVQAAQDGTSGRQPVSG